MSKSDSNDITRDYFDSMLLETRYIDSDLPSTKTTLFDYTFETPIMTAALSHLHDVCPNGMTEFAKGAADAKAACFVGMGEENELEEMLETKAKIIKIIKPHKDNAVIFRKIDHAIEHGAIAVGMDIDHAYAANGTYDCVCGLSMTPKSFGGMKSFVDASSVPFVVKGVLSPYDAEMSVKVGAKAIIVSHHHGIMPYSIPPLMALPEIKKAVGNDITVLVDCGFESGMDVFKALALGADGVCVGRELMKALKGGSEAMTRRIVEMTLELKTIMARTGSKSVKDIDPSVIHFRNF